MSTHREVHEDDAFHYLAGCTPDEHTGIVTSVPDADALSLTQLEYSEWLTTACGALMGGLKDGCPLVLFQTDRKADGVWNSKAHQIMQQADLRGLDLLWHKIVVRRDPGKVDIHRPGFSHLIAFGYKCRPGKATPDLIERSKPVYKEGAPLGAAMVAAQFILNSGCDTLLDPFCGMGTFLAAANAVGMNSIGVEIDHERAERARILAPYDLVPGFRGNPSCWTVEP